MKQRYERYTEEFGRRLSDAAARAGRQRRHAGILRLQGRPALAGLATALLLALAVVASTHSASRPARHVASAAGAAPALENEAQAPDLPDEYLDLKQSSAQDVSVAQVRRAQAQAAAVPDAANPGAWALAGPAAINRGTGGGRLVDLVVDDQQPDTIYVAASGGGIWKSTDRGTTFTPAWPDDHVQNMGSLAQDAHGVLWAGTGEANPSGGGLTYFGDGIYRSADGGATWQHMGLEDSAAIGRIAVDPTDATGNTVFAAASGSISRVAGQRGLYRTTDGGQTWKLVLAPPNPTTGAIDIAVDPSAAHPHRIYAALWDHKRNNGARVYGGIGSGLFRSDDNGDTWTRLQNVVDPLPFYDQPTDGGGAGKGDVTTGSTTIANVTTTSGAFQAGHQIAGTGIPNGTTITAVGNDGTLTISAAPTRTTAGATLTDFRPGTGLTADPSLGRIGVTFAPSNPDRIYVAFGSPYGPDKGFYYSDDGGDSFRVGGRAYAASGYQWWFGRLWVDPADQNHLFNADVSLRESNDGGLTWHNSSGAHSDQHAMAWDPRVPGRVYLGNDGGAYRSDTNGASASWIPGTYQPWFQSYHLDVARDDATRLVTGLQDNGSIRTWTDTAPPGDLTQWNPYGGGDGHTVAIDPTDHTYYYECFQPVPPRQDCAGFHDVNGTRQQTSFSNASWPANQRWTTDTPFALDPTDPSIVYVGGSTLGRSTDRGAHFTVISPADDADSLPGPVPADENDLGPFYANEYAAITAIAPATDSHTIYVGTDTGRMWKTSDLGGTWTRLSGTPTRWVNAIISDPTDVNHVYAAFSGYREGDESANVYESSDGGATWQNISLNLPNGPVEEISYDQAHHVLYAATDFGLFDRKDGDSSWYNVGAGGIPRVPIMDVKFSGDGKWLYAATFGRSVWRLPLSVSVTQGDGSRNGGTGGTVPATLSLTLGAPASFGAFTPGVDKTYDAATTADVVSTAGDAALTASGPVHMTNGAFSLPDPLQVDITPATWSAPVAHDPVAIAFHQHIGSTDALRTGSYSATVTFTLSTTNP
jgi:photosystem II stability/assembly factor-like uncharacterized protein